MPAELVELDNALTADVAAAVGSMLGVLGTACAKTQLWTTAEHHCTDAPS